MVYFRNIFFLKLFFNVNEMEKNRLGLRRGGNFLDECFTGGGAIKSPCFGFSSFSLVGCSCVNLVKKMARVKSVKLNVALKKNKLNNVLVQKSKVLPRKKKSVKENFGRKREYSGK